MSNELAPLDSLGWSSSLAEALAALPGTNLIPARVVSQHRGEIEVLTAQGLGRAHVRPALTTDEKGLAVGDWVALCMKDGGAFVVEAVLPRQTAFSRKAPGNQTKRQWIAANVDVVFIMSALDRTFNPRRIERTIALVRAGGATPVVVLTKSDLCPNAEELARSIHHDLVHPMSAVTGEGVDALRQYIGPGRTVALTGPSGVGKSTLANHLLRQELQAVQQVRGKDGKGRHTTVARRILPLPDGGALLDTPGMRELGLWADDTSEDALLGTFEDIARLTTRCAFRDCSHEHEPGCAVLMAVEDGQLDATRLENYKKLLRELHWQEIRQNVGALRQEYRNRGKRIRKTLTLRMRLKGREE